MLSGRLFEDFFPLDGDTALITTGPKLNRLNCIEWISYSVDDGAVRLYGDGQAIIEAEGVRLGGMFDGQIVYSYKGGLVYGSLTPSMTPIISPTAHQPFFHERSMYYTDDWPGVKIYRDGEIYIDHFANMVQVGNPCWIGEDLYFEARENPDPRRAELWQIWRMRDSQLEFVRHGANPAGLPGKLFWGEWNGKFFDYYCTEID